VNANARLSIGRTERPSRFGPRDRGQDDPLRRLMLAMLGDALDCLSRGASESASSARRKAAREAGEWVNNTAEDNLFSFNCVCETLGIHPEALRKSLEEWVAAGSRLARRAPVMGPGSVSTSPYRRRKGNSPVHSGPEIRALPESVPRKLLRLSSNINV
jgi:hypothetical protein